MFQVHQKKQSLNANCGLKRRKSMMTKKPERTVVPEEDSKDFKGQLVKISEEGQPVVIGGSGKIHLVQREYNVKLPDQDEQEN